MLIYGRSFKHSFRLSWFFYCDLSRISSSLYFLTFQTILKLHWITKQLVKKGMNSLQIYIWSTKMCTKFYAKFSRDINLFILKKKTTYWRTVLFHNAFELVQLMYKKLAKNPAMLACTSNLIVADLPSVTSIFAWVTCDLWPMTYIPSYLLYINYQNNVRLC